MRYEVIYDISRELPVWALFPLAGVLFAALGYLMIRYRHHEIMTTVFRWGPETARLRAVFFSIWLAFSIVWTVAASIGVGVTEVRSRYAMYSDSALVVEGVVEDFVPATRYRKAESFTVAGVEFSYRDDTYTGGFHQTSLENGPIRENLPVRI